MSEPKPLASLSSGLLARKGSAKPAMRPQGFGPMGGMDDLGWNDMGHAPQAPAARLQPFDDEPREHVPSSIAALTPAPRLNDKTSEHAESVNSSEHVEPVEPPVVGQQRAIAASFGSEPEPEAVEPEPAAAPIVALPRRPRKAPGSKGKAAFTLRLDPDRHLKLRLACAIRHRSAQQIVSEALDTFLESLPELDNLTDQLPVTAAKTN